MKFRYVGDGKDSPLKTTAFGYFFLLNEETEVSDPLAVSKLSNNRCFVVVEESEEKTVADLVFAEEPEIVEPPPEPESTVPVVTTYAKPRGRPKGPSRT